MDLNQFSKNILKYDDFVIIPHVNPDGDSIGSSFALCSTLRKAGKKAYVVNGIKEKMPNQVDFLWSDDFLMPKTFIPKTAFCVDCADNKRMFDEDIFNGCENTFCVDHHKTNVGYADFNYIDPVASATGEIIFEIAKAFNHEIDKLTAKYIFCAISCDTGNFKYSNVTSKTFRIAAELYDVYGEFSSLTHNMFDTYSINQIKANQYVLSNLKLLFDGKVALASVDYEYLEKNNIEFEEVDFLSSLPRTIKGVEVGIFAKIKRDEIKFSLRSNEYIDVSQIAVKFGGGGHKRASGVSFLTSFDEACEKLLGEIKKEIG